MKTYALLCFLFLSCSISAQQAMTFEKAKADGLHPKLDSIYKSAIHSNPKLAVFKTDAEIEKHITAYQDFLMDLGAFLLKNNFRWDETTRAFNRIYIRPDGTIDYFLYHFNTPLSKDKHEEFERLLNLYIKDRKFGVTAKEKFPQCSPVTYPRSE